MNKRMKILQVLFLLIIINEIVTQSPTNNPNESPTQDPNESPTQDPNESPNESPNEIERQKKLCDTTQPLKGIKEECFKGNELSYGETCCYMTIKYETNEYFSCVAVKKDKSLIKEKINQIKKDYEGSKSIDIDCKSSFIKIYLISFLFFII